MAMKWNPQVRVMVGRNVSLVAGCAYALSRAIYYASAHPPDLSPAQDIVTGAGARLIMWAALWGIAAAMCIVDMVNHHTRHGLSLVAGLAFAWGFAYTCMWAATGFNDFELLSSAVGWLTPSAIVWGFLLKVQALRDMLSKQPGGGSD